MTDYSFITRRISFFLAIGCFLVSQQMLSQNIITTYAGTGTGAFSGDGGLATAAQIKLPNDIYIDASGNKYIADNGNHCIRKIDGVTGIITTIVGTGGTSGFSGDGGLATAAKINSPYTVCLDNTGNIYFTDGSNQRIRKVDALTGIITTVAGTGVSGYSGDGGAATTALLKDPYGLVVDSNGDVLWSEFGNSIIRKLTVSSGIISTYAGTGTTGSTGDGGAATLAKFNFMRDICIDALNNIYIADRINYKIRKITAVTGIVSTIAGTGTFGSTGDGGLATLAKIRTPFGICIDPSGNIYIADTGNNKIRKITAGTGIITTFAGTGISGYSGDGGDALLAKLNFPTAIYTEGIYVYIVDNSNHRIRQIEIVPVLLPLGTTNFEAVVTSQKNVELNWKSELQNSLNHFEIERSPNGIDWELLTNKPAIQSELNETNYRSIDENPSTGISYYRLSAIDCNGTKEIINLASVKIDVSASVFPNPVSGETTHLMVDFPSNSPIIVEWIDNTGKIVKSETLKNNTKKDVLTLETTEINSGKYALSIQHEGQIKLIEQVIIIK